MNGTLIRTLVLSEVRLRSRRLSSLVALLAMVGFAWLVITDPHTGHAMFVMNKVRALYTSSVVSMGSALLISPIFSLLSFYLMRGRIGEDLRSGIGSVIGASQVGNGEFLFSRWLGGVAYLLMLQAAFMLSVMALQVLYGEAPLHILPYLQAWFVVLLPAVFFAISCALLFESVPALMGKGGDVLYFIFWTMQISLISQMDKMATPGMHYWMAFDFTGMVSGIANLKAFVGTHFSLGRSTFNAAIAPVVFNDLISTPKLYAVRALSAAMAFMPLLLAMRVFHRYSPDKVKASHSKQRRSPLTVLNDLLRPLSRLVQPLFALGARLPGLPGKVVSDIALSLVAAPAAMLILALLTLLGWFGASVALPGVLVWAAAVWGILISDISTRDFQSNLEDMTGAVPGGAVQRYLRQILASNVIGLVVMGGIALRWSSSHPTWALALLAGIFGFSAIASLLGRTSRTSRTFLALFLFWVYAALQVHSVARLDVLGFNGVVNSAATVQHFTIGLMALLLGIGYNRWRSQ